MKKLIVMIVGGIVLIGLVFAFINAVSDDTPDVEEAVQPAAFNETWADLEDPYEIGLAVNLKLGNYEQTEPEPFTGEFSEDDAEASSINLVISPYISERLISEHLSPDQAVAYREWAAQYYDREGNMIKELPEREVDIENTETEGE